ncbi:cation:proton antiporter regulatory subunit [Nocardia sp. 004]|uniref:cation:proton antiporter regulatory subunit n=1 Tax=Nocardia sp. 004 TaxID=3385978 RepID=UPI0039A12B8B
MNVEVTPLPGIGVRKEFPSVNTRRRIGVIDRRDGTMDLIMSKAENPDEADHIALSGNEAAVLAGLLGAPQVVEQPREEQRQFTDLITRQLSILDRSRYDGRRLGDTQMRTRTKASIVAVVRSGQTLPSPGPDFTFTAGDVLIVVGAAESLEAAAKILLDG